MSEFVVQPPERLHWCYTWCVTYIVAEADDTHIYERLCSTVWIHCSVADSISAFNARPKILRTPDGVRRDLPGDGSPLQPKYSDSLPTPRPGSGGYMTGEHYLTVGNIINLLWWRLTTVKTHNSNMGQARSNLAVSLIRFQHSTHVQRYFEHCTV